MKKDAQHFTSVNFSRLIHSGEHEDHDPFIDASQTQMVYYIEDKVDKGWSVVVNLKPRDLYDMGDDIDEVCENMPYEEQDLDSFFTNDLGHIPLAREDDVDNEPLSPILRKMVIFMI